MKKNLAFLLVLFAAIWWGAPSESFAQIQGQPNQPQPRAICTNGPEFAISAPAEGQGMISAIVLDVQGTLNTVTQQMFDGIRNDTGYREAVTATVTLYIIIYGVMFTFGMVQITLYDFLIRMIKIGVVFWMFESTAWRDFNNYVIYFFNSGTDDIINQLSSIAVGQPGLVASGPPFAILDGAISKAVSAKMAVTLLAMFFTGPYGVLFALLLLASLGSFLRSLITAVWVYLMALVLRSLLFALSPIFIAFLLFNRTRHLFDGWLNQIVNSCLQPILLFAFFAFFAKLIEASIDQILAVKVCWTEAPETLRGTPFDIHYWRFTLNNQPYSGLWSWTGAESSANSPVFPIEIMTILIFLVLAELASRFNSVVLMIASDLAGASTNLAKMQGAFSEWFSPANNAKNSVMNKIGRRGVPGAPTGGRAGGNRGGKSTEDMLEQDRDGQAAQSMGDRSQKMLDSIRDMATRDRGE